LFVRFGFCLNMKNAHLNDCTHLHLIIIIIFIIIIIVVVVVVVLIIIIMIGNKTRDKQIAGYLKDAHIISVRSSAIHSGVLCNTGTNNV
jgi:heme/copper-type cytochrome/quinol oxidase subunit 2